MIARQAPLTTHDNFHAGRAWFAVAVLVLFSMFSILDRQIIALLVDPIKADLGLSDTQLGLLQGLAFGLLYATAGLPIGWAVDRHPRRIIIYLGITIWSLSSAACGLARNFWQLFLCRTFVGVGEAVLNPAAVSLISDLFPRGRVSTPLGVYSTGNYIGAGIALAVGGWIISLFAGQPAVHFPLIGDVAPWQAVFLITGLPGALVAALAFLIFDPRPSIHPMPAATLSTVPLATESFITFLRVRWVVISLSFMAYASVTFSLYAMASWTPAYYMRVFGWSAAQIGGAYGLVTAIPGCIGAFGGGMLMDRVYRSGRNDAYALIATWAGVIATPSFILAYLVASPVISIALLSIGTVMFGVTAAGSYSTWQKIAPAIFRGRLTATFTIVSAIYGVGIGPLSVGMVTDYVMGSDAMVGYSIVTVLSFSLPLTTLLFFLSRKHLRDLRD